MTVLRVQVSNDLGASPRQKPRTYLIFTRKPPTDNFAIIYPHTLWSYGDILLDNLCKRHLFTDPYLRSSTSSIIAYWRVFPEIVQFHSPSGTDRHSSFNTVSNIAYTAA